MVFENKTTSSNRLRTMSNIKTYNLLLKIFFFSGHVYFRIDMQYVLFHTILSFKRRAATRRISLFPPVRVLRDWLGCTPSRAGGAMKWGKLGGEEHYLKERRWEHIQKWINSSMDWKMAQNTALYFRIVEGRNLPAKGVLSDFWMECAPPLRLPE